MARKIWPNPEEVEVQFVLLKTLFHIMRNLTFALIQRVFLERFFYLNPNLLGGSNINLQSKDKDIFGRKSANGINKEMPHLTRSYLEFCRTFLRTNNNKVYQSRWSNCDPCWSYTYELTWQSQSVRHHRSWSIWSWPDVLHKKEIPTQIS